jgi:hypothetical protein
MHHSVGWVAFLAFSKKRWTAESLCSMPEWCADRISLLEGDTHLSVIRIIHTKVYVKTWALAFYNPTNMLYYVKSRFNYTLSIKCCGRKGVGGDMVIINSWPYKRWWNELKPCLNVCWVDRGCVEEEVSPSSLPVFAQSKFSNCFRGFLA